MDEKELNKRYRRMIKRRGRSGASRQECDVVAQKPCGESSPYWSWINNHSRVNEEGEIEESATANVDAHPFAKGADIQSAILAEETSREVSGRVRKLLELSKQILTESQYHVFILLAVREPHLTQREVAKVLNISRTTVQDHWESARKKLEKAYEQRTA